jgi:hypothetical protein
MRCLSGRPPRVDAAQIKRPTRVEDARGGRGATVASNPRAHANAGKRLREFLAQNLRVD